jgi:hypothetical protein
MTKVSPVSNLVFFVGANSSVDEDFNQHSSPDELTNFHNLSKSNFVTKRCNSRKVQLTSHVETDKSSSNGVFQLSLAATNLNESATGTPRAVLRQQINLKDETIRKLATDFEELQEYTKLESEVAVDEEREELKEKDVKIEQLKREIERCRKLKFYSKC